MKTVMVQWSYPSSPNAQRFGFPRGCWTVETMEGTNPPEALAGFHYAGEAMRYAVGLGLPFHPMFERFGHSTLKRALAEVKP